VDGQDARPQLGQQQARQWMSLSPPLLTWGTSDMGAPPFASARPIPTPRSWAMAQSSLHRNSSACIKSAAATPSTWQIQRPWRFETWRCKTRSSPFISMGTLLAPLRWHTVPSKTAVILGLAILGFTSCPVSRPQARTKSERSLQGPPWHFHPHQVHLDVPRCALDVPRCALLYQGAPLMCQGAPWCTKARP
jgi:hypothetical protein